jgi:dienelactone hydrolase
LAAATGCVAHVPLSDRYSGPQALPPQAAVDEPLGAAPVVASPGELRRDGLGFSVERLSLPSSAASAGVVDFEYYNVDGSERTPVVVLLPIFNGQLIVTRYFARYFAHQGWAAVVVDRERDLLEEIDRPEQAIRANLVDYQRVLDWVEQQPDLDSGRVGLFGISFGAMDAVMLAALDRRVDALVAAMAGGDLAYLLMNTNYRRVARTVDEWLETSGLTREELRRSIDERIVTDPLALAPYVDAERVLMIMTRSDAIVPFEAQQALRASLGAPETLYLPTGHRTSIVFFPRLRSRAYEFFARHFEAGRVSAAWR